MKTIIGINGKKGHGKDTVADYLILNHGFKRVGFSDEIKNILWLLFEHKIKNKKYLWGDIEQKESYIDDSWLVPDDICVEMNLEKQPWTGRALLQYTGTYYARKICSNVWSETASKKIENSSDNLIVVSDVRYPEELESLRRIKNSIFLFVKVDSNRRVMNTNFSHESEYALDDYKEELLLENNSSIDELYASINEKIIKKFLFRHHE